MDLPHDRRPSAFDEAWRAFRARLSGPIGCLLALLCLPFALLALVVMFGVALWKGRALRRAWEQQIAADRGGGAAAPPSAGASSPPAAAATLALVRALALDASFTREEAAQMAVPASAGRSAADLLDDAIRRGWVGSAPHERLTVTAAGRAALGDAH